MPEACSWSLQEAEIDMHLRSHCCWPVMLVLQGQRGQDLMAAHHGRDSQPMPPSQGRWEGSASFFSGGKGYNPMQQSRCITRDWGAVGSVHQKDLQAHLSWPSNCLVSKNWVGDVDGSGDCKQRTKVLLPAHADTSGVSQPGRHIPGTIPAASKGRESRRYWHRSLPAPIHHLQRQVGARGR